MDQILPFLQLKHELRVLLAEKEKILDASSVDCELLDELNRKEQSLVRLRNETKHC